jgi:hypothetical protein
MIVDVWEENLFQKRIWSAFFSLLLLLSVGAAIVYSFVLCSVTAFWWPEELTPSDWTLVVLPALPRGCLVRPKQTNKQSSVIISHRIISHHQSSHHQSSSSVIVSHQYLSSVSHYQSSQSSVIISHRNHQSSSSSAQLSLVIASSCIISHRQSSILIISHRQSPSVIAIIVIISPQ